MISISELNAKLAWEKTFILLYKYGQEVEFNGFYKNSCAAIEIEDITGISYTDIFPMSPKEIELINQYIINGKNEEKIDHDWTKLYRKRLFLEENRLDKVIDLLKKKPDSPRAQISIWNSDRDYHSKIAPCLQLLWFKIIDNSLDLHVHMRTSDCYGKLLMNFNEFISIQKYIANKLSLDFGFYRQFIDSCHFHKKDRNTVDKLYQIISK